MYSRHQHDAHMRSVLLCSHPYRDRYRDRGFKKSAPDTDPDKYRNCSFLFAVRRKSSNYTRDRKRVKSSAVFQY